MHCWGHFLHLGGHFWTSLEYFCTIFDIINQIRPSKAPPRPPPRFRAHILGPILEPFFFHFSNFLAEEVGSEICHVFSLIFGSPWALHGMGSHAIRARRRSQNTLFRFYTFSRKKAHRDFICAPFWRLFWFQNCTLSEKRASKKCSKKG